ncbi:MAG TPA: ABC transporter permease, partial [Longimicrobiales bacterium]|nr:ABC transporter permease [Longimicrobiales bacterium]
MSLYDRLRNLGRTDRLNREIERELAFHVEEKAAALRAAGMSEADALHEARRRVGNVDVQRERTRDADVIGWLDWLLRDVRHAARGLRRTPVFTFVAVASLALGIGANTAIFTLIDAVVLRPLPVRAPEELVILGMSENESVGYFTNPLWEQVRDNQGGLSSVAAFSHTRFNTAAGGEARWVDGAWVSGDYFRVFGVHPAIGRLFTTADDARGCTPLAVLSHGYWQGAFGGDAAVLGQRLTLEGTSFEIIGVAPDGFRGADVGDNPQVFLPLCAEAAVAGERSMLDARSTWWLNVMGRRAPGLTMEQLGARLAAIAPAAYAATLPEHYPPEHREEYLSRSFHAHAAPTGISQVRDRYAGALLILMTGVGLILLIACANVANLLIARGFMRQKELAVRLSLGASRGRLVRQLLVESLVLSLAGGLAGVALAVWLTRALIALVPTGEQPLLVEATPDLRILAFASALTVATGIVFGLLPALR